MIKERIKSFSYALKGIRLLFGSEINARVHLVFTFCVVGAGFFFSINSTEWSLIILAIAMVLSAEAMNTAIEFLTDLVSPEYHDLAKKTKDLAAGAVLITAIGAALIGAIIFLPKIF